MYGTLTDNQAAMRRRIQARQERAEERLVEEDARQKRRLYEMWKRSRTEDPPPPFPNYAAAYRDSRKYVPQLHCYPLVWWMYHPSHAKPPK